MAFRIEDVECDRGHRTEQLLERAPDGADWDSFKTEPCAECHGPTQRVISAQVRPWRGVNKTARV